MSDSATGTGLPGEHASAAPHARCPRDGGPPPGPPPPGASGSSTLFDTLRVAVAMMDITGRVVLWSPLAEEMLGWSGDQLVGRRLGMVLAGEAARPPRRGAVAPPPGLADRILGQLLRDGRWDGVLALRHRDGHTVQVEALASLLVGGDGRPLVLAAAAESSRLRTVEHDLAALASLFDSSPLGIAIIDTDLRYVRVNEALARMNRVSVADHLGRTSGEILWPPFADEVTAMQREVLDTGRPITDAIARSPDGTGYRSLSYSRLEDGAGRILGISCTAMDVTERRQAAAKAERARERLALLNDIGSRIADLLDVRRIAQALARALVPPFGDYSGVIVHRAVAFGGDLPRQPYTDPRPLLQLGTGPVRPGPDTDADRALRPERQISFQERSVFGRVLRTGVPVLVGSEEQLRRTACPDDPEIDCAVRPGVHSLLAVPLRARGIVLGLLVVSRATGREPFDGDDLALATELADRAGASLDNARLYARERQHAITLQRSLLPQSVPEPPGVRVAFRYLPGSSGTEAGGDWFDVIPLAGGRIAFVVGDVMGHGVPAAVTMGRLRTAVRTLAGLDLPPHELLRRINDLGDDLAQVPGEPWMATCLYAVYDPSSRHCTLARAGHLPPLLVCPDGGGVRQVETPPGVPLGVGAEEFESVEFAVPEGAVLVLYTDGLVERRGEDITDGLDRLSALLHRPYSSLDDACDRILADLAEEGGEPDDLALLMARLGGFPAGSTAGWSFPAEASAVRLARRKVRETLAEWELPQLGDVTVLLVSELVTNSLRYAHGPIGVRLVRGTSLLVEVSDPLPDPPRERVATAEDEGGRGLQLVARAARRWGTRHGQFGKTVWFELAVQGS